MAVRLTAGTRVGNEYGGPKSFAAQALYRCG